MGFSTVNAICIKKILKTWANCFIPVVSPKSLIWIQILMGFVK